MLMRLLICYSFLHSASVHSSHTRYIDAARSILTGFKYQQALTIPLVVDFAEHYSEAGADGLRLARDFINACNNHQHEVAHDIIAHELTHYINQDWGLSNILLAAIYPLGHFYKTIACLNIIQAFLTSVLGYFDLNNYYKLISTITNIVSVVAGIYYILPNNQDTVFFTEPRTQRIKYCAFFLYMSSMLIYTELCKQQESASTLISEAFASFIEYWILWLVYYSFERYVEKYTDITSAQKYGTAYGSVIYLTNYLNKQKLQKSYYEIFKSFWEQLTATHPTDMQRLLYLLPIAQAQSSRS